LRPPPTPQYHAQHACYRRAQGLPHKLEGYELFLSKFPEWRNKVVLIQVAVPSREDVPEYQKLKKGTRLGFRPSPFARDESRGRLTLPSHVHVTPPSSTVVDQMVGRINMEYGSLEHQPIHYLYHSVNFTELCSLYTLGMAILPSPPSSLLQRGCV
jgi:trehalose-6-phosphate synthase